MKKTIRPAANSFIIGIVLSNLISAAEFHVAPTGDDIDPGTLAEPLGTIQAGVERLQPGDTLIVHGGTYRETVVLPLDGQPGRPITVRAAEGEKVIITGCEPIGGWKLHDERKGIWQAPMDWDLGKGRNQVFQDDEVLIEARHPNVATPGLEMPVADLHPLWPTFGPFSIENPRNERNRLVSPLLAGAAPDDWKGAIYLGVHFEGWGAQSGVVDSSGDGELRLKNLQAWFDGFAGKANRQQPPHNPQSGRGMLVGHRSALDQPGEWHLEDGTLYLVTEPGSGPPTGIVAKRRPLGLDLRGRRHVHVSGLTIHSAAVDMRDCIECMIDDCRVLFPTHYTQCGDRTGRREANHGFGIWVSGRDNEILHSTVFGSAGGGIYLQGLRHQVHNCLIDQIGHTAGIIQPVTLGNDLDRHCGGHAVTFCTLANAGRENYRLVFTQENIINMRDGFQSRVEPCLAAHNHMFNGMLYTRDHGIVTFQSIDMAGNYGVKSPIAYNAIHDIFDPWAAVTGNCGMVYMEFCAWNLDNRNNILWAHPISVPEFFWANSGTVGVTWDNNRCHKNFTRTAAELKPEDFPGKKPFRFGHDFENPPPKPEWPLVETVRLEAGRAAAVSDGVSRNADRLTHLADGAWADLGEVDFSKDWDAVVMSHTCTWEKANVARHPHPRHKNATDPLVFAPLEYDDCNGKFLQKRGRCLSAKSNRAWIEYKEVPLGAGYQFVKVPFGVRHARGARLEIRLDAPNGELVANIPLARTEDSRTLPNRSPLVQLMDIGGTPLSPSAKGTRDVFVVFVQDQPGKVAEVAEIMTLRFEGARGPIELTREELKVELVLDSPDGPKIADLFPRYTGPRAAYRETASPVFKERFEAKGKRRVFLRVLSAGLPLAAIDWIEFVKARPAKLPLPGGEGLNPNPYVANRPLDLPVPDPARKREPVERYRHPVPQIAGELTVDGKLHEWPIEDKEQSLKIVNPQEQMMGQAWLAHDGDALCIAARFPLRNPAAIKPDNYDPESADVVRIALETGASRDRAVVLTGFPDGHVILENDEAKAPANLIENLREQITHAAALKADSWTTEWRIPLSALGIETEGGKLPAPGFNIKMRASTPPDHGSWIRGGYTWDLRRAAVLDLQTHGGNEP